MAYKRENSQKSLADDISPPLDLHRSQNVDNIFITLFLFSPHVMWSVSMSCGHSDLKLEYVVSSGVNILSHNITFKGH